MKTSSELSEEMYHRLYRLAKRQVSPKLIAAALNIPVRTVQTVLNRMEQGRNDLSSEKIIEIINDPEEKSLATESFLDIYFYPKTRYAVLELVGILDSETFEKFNAELQRVTASSWKAVALKFTDVSVIDELSSKQILSFSKDLLAHGRYVAILDPAPAIEPLLIEFGLDPAIPIFGTERAFDDKALSLKKSASSVWKMRP